MTLSENLKLIEDCLAKVDKDVEIEMTVNASLHEDVPDGYEEDESMVDSHNLYRKVIDAKNGKPTKTIALFIPW